MNILQSGESSKIQDMRPKIVETKDGIVINTHYYTKKDLNPVPFEVLNLTLNWRILQLKRVLYCGAYSWRIKDTVRPPIDDDLDNDRYYIFFRSGYGGESTACEYLYKIKEKDFKIDSLNFNPSYTGLSYGDIQFIEELFRDDTYIYILDLTGSYAQINRIKKNFDSSGGGVLWQASFSYSYPYPKKLAEDESFVYYSIYGNNYVYIYQINKTTKSIIGTYIYRGGTGQVAANYTYSNRCDEVIKLNDDEYGVIYYNAGNPQQPLDIYTVNISLNFTTTYTSACDIKHININWNSGYNQIKYLTDAYSASAFYRVFIREYNNKKYLFVAFYNENYESNKFIEAQGIYSFSIDDDTYQNITFIDYNPIDTGLQISSILFDETGFFGIVAKNQSISIIKLDQEKNKWVTIGNSISNLSTAGFDSYGRLWTLDLSGKVDVNNLHDCQSINIEFEKKFYEFKNTNIETYIEFTADNFLNENFIGKFKLDITGSALFKETNAKSLTFDYMGGVTQIPIIINGVNTVEIFTTYISD